MRIPIRTATDSPTWRELPLNTPVAPLERGVPVIAGLHSPQQNAKAVKNLIRFIGEWRPDRVLLLAPQSGWCDTARVSCQGFISFLEALRQSYELPVVVQTNAFPLPDSPPLHWSNQCIDALQALDITLHSGLYPVAPGWYSLCANSRSVKARPGSLAMTLARSLRTSVICSGTEGLAAVGQTPEGHENASTFLWGIETGTLGPSMAQRSSDSAVAVGFALLEASGSLPLPTIVPVERDGSFTVAGNPYG